MNIFAVYCFSLLRHFMRELNTKLENGNLGEYLVQFVNLWVALNCDILRGGPVTLEKCIRSQLSLSSHPDKHLGRFIQWSRSQASSIDGYVMSGNDWDIDDKVQRHSYSSYSLQTSLIIIEKIIVDQATEATQSPLSASPGKSENWVTKNWSHNIFTAIDNTGGIFQIWYCNTPFRP